MKAFVLLLGIVAAGCSTLVTPHNGVTPTEGFRIVPESNALEITADATKNFKLKILRSSSLSNTAILLGTSGLPQDVSATFELNPVYGDSAVVHLVATNMARESREFIMIWGESKRIGWPKKSIVVNLHVKDKQSSSDVKEKPRRKKPTPVIQTPFR
jgi:hypothetical protein